MACDWVFGEKSVKVDVNHMRLLSVVSTWEAEMRGVFVSEGKLEEVASAEDVAMTAGGKRGAVGAGLPVIADVSLSVAAGGGPELVMARDWEEQEMLGVRMKKFRQVLTA